MSRPTKAQREANIHADALAQFDEIESALRSEREQCLADRRFYSIAGAQWEGPLADQFENKPKFEVNKVALAVTKIINEYRNNRITVDFVSKEGAEYDDLADTCDGLYRADEQDSGAEEAYDNAFEESVGGGFGAWRLRTKYVDEEDDEDERQRICIEPIFDADSSVFFDLGAKRQDKADAKYCFVLTSMTPQAYRDEWGDDPASWPKAITQREFDWFTADAVYVAEYYKVEETRHTVKVFVDLQGEETRYTEEQLDADEMLEERLLATGSKLVREKRVKRKRVHKWILSGGSLLEDCGYIAGSCIPVVPTYGKRWFVDNVERCAGHVRNAKDPQRLKNMQLSKLGELAGLSSVEKPIFTPEQVAGHTVMWSEDNLRNYPYLLLNPITDVNGQTMPAGPIGYTKPPQIAPAMAALLQITEEDMQQILGTNPDAEKMVSNISGKAVEMIQQRLDMQTFIYVSNMAKAIRRSGEIWLSMAREVYVEEKRRMKTVSASGETGSVDLLVPKVGENGEIEYTNDLTEARFDVAVEVGPSSASRRAATVRALIGMMQTTTDPETMAVLSSMAMMNMEGEGLSEIRAFFRQKLLKLGAVQPTEEEKLEMASQPPQPDPNTTYLNAAAEEASAKAVKARADTVLTIARTEEAKANAMKTVSEVDAIEQRQALEVIDRFTAGPAPAQPPMQ